MFTVSRGLARTRVGAVRIRPAAAANTAALLTGVSPRHFSSSPARARRPTPAEVSARFRAADADTTKAVPSGSRVELPMLDGQERLEFIWGKDGIEFINESEDGGAHMSVLELRDSCSCTACRDVSSGQKSYSTTQLPLDMEITNVQVTKEEGLVVTVNKDMETHGGSAGHDIYLSPSWMSHQIHSMEDKERAGFKLLRRFGKDYWDRSQIQSKVRRIDYQEFMQEDSTAFWDVVSDLARLGLVFLRNVPKEEDAVERIANRIACIRETFYGRTFDVRVKPNAENVAYTSGYLGLHQDLMYLNPPPYIQILHCMDNSCQGGESLFSDAERVGHMLHQMRNEYKMLYSLIKTLVPYGYDRNDKYYRQNRPIIATQKHAFLGVFWSPPFQNEWRKPQPLLADWIASAGIFEEAVNAPEAMYQTRMEPGDCALFNNLRVLHGRTAFDAAVGSRWLRGTYLALEDFLSTAMQAPETHAAPSIDYKKSWDRVAAGEHLQATRAYDQLKMKVAQAQAGSNLRAKQAQKAIEDEQGHSKAKNSPQVEDEYVPTPSNLKDTPQGASRGHGTFEEAIRTARRG